MTKEVLKYVLDKLEQQEVKNRELYKLDIDITNFLDEYNTIITTLLRVYYGEEGEDWLSWYLYERDPEAPVDQASDENGNPICYDFDSLWEILEQCRLKKEEYVLPKVMTMDEKIALINLMMSK